MGVLYDGDPNWVLFIGTTPDASNNSGIVSVETISAGDDFTAFPNPSNGIVNFNDAFDVTLYSIEGRMIKQYRNEKSIDVSYLPAGLYFLQNQNGQLIRLMKQ
ncbi:MAG: T9SS type A sorting domain-containing protein [Flavobacteriales bacterium]